MVKIAKGLTLPFYPMRAMPGRLLNRRAITSIRTEMQQHLWVVQPVLRGTRAILGVSHGSVYVYDGHKKLITSDVLNAASFTKLQDGACFDGVVHEGAFHPFEVLAVHGRSLLFATTSERAVLAESLTRFVNQRYLFDTPTTVFMNRLGRNDARWTGIVLKLDHAPYVISPDATVSTDWTFRPWASGSYQHAARRAARKNAGVES